MAFTLTEEQLLLKESVRRLIENEYSPNLPRQSRDDCRAFIRKRWSKYAKMGLLALPFPEAQGGLSGSAIDVMLVMEALGRSLALEPYLETIVLSGMLLGTADGNDPKGSLLQDIMAGERFVALAHTEPKAGRASPRLETLARAEGGGYRLTGRKQAVVSAPDADRILISACTTDASTADDGITLFLVDPHLPGLSLHSYTMIDGQRAADINLDNVSVGADSVVGTPGQASAPIEIALDRAVAGMVAEAVGAMEALNELTLDYLKTRQQFGAPIGSFQVLQHRMVDMTIEYEMSKSMAMLAAYAVDSDDSAERRRVASAARIFVGKASRFVGEQAIQLHGSIGLTDEHIASHYFKRLVAIDRRLNADDDTFHWG